jgi:hypothetical protein
LRKAIGGALPITQPELAKLVEAALPTLKWLGNRPMSTPLLEKIRFATGAIWDPEKKRWLFDRWVLTGVEDVRFVPFTHDLFLAYRQILTSPPADPDRELVLMMAWLDQLFKRMPAEHWMQLQRRVGFFVEEACRDFGLGEPEDLFASAAREWGPTLDQMTEKRLKGKSGKQILEVGIQEMKRAIPWLGPDTEEGKVARSMAQALDRGLKKSQ